MKNFSQNGVGYYNIEEHKYNIEEHSCNDSVSLPVGRAAPSAHEVAKPLDLEPRDEVEPLDSGAEEEAAPLGPHNVKRALVQFFNNPDGRKIKVRLNLADGTNAEFIAPLQPKDNLTNFLRYTGDYKEQAREWFTKIRAYCKREYGTKPQQGKFHENTGKRTNKLKTITIEPTCYASVVYNQTDRIYVGYIKIYDVLLTELQLDDGYLSELQKKTNVRGQYLWINPLFDTRTRPLTWAEKRKRGIA
jgi:hypothetical protein